MAATHASATPHLEDLEHAPASAALRFDRVGKVFPDGTRAVDNASGVAQLLAQAKAFAALPTPPKRSIMMLFVAAEEQGLGRVGYIHGGTAAVTES